jgi:hypothetical protein
MASSEPHPGIESSPSALDNREQLGRLLSQAFPLSDSGSFTTILDAIRTKADEVPLDLVLMLPGN